MSYQFGIEFEFSMSNAMSRLPDLYRQIRSVITHPKRRIVSHFDTVCEEVHNNSRNSWLCGPCNYCERYDNGIQWTLKEDVSCGYELSTPPSSGYNLREIFRVLDILRSTSGITVPVNTGMHVHVDHSDLGARGRNRFIYLWYMFEPLLYQMVRRSRRNSSWCAPIRSVSRYDRRSSSNSHSWNSIVGLTSQPNYSDIGELYDHLHGQLSLAASRHGKPTMEIRMHGGSLNQARVNRWIAILGGFYRTAKNTNLDKLHEVERTLEGVTNHNDQGRILGKLLNKYSRTSFNWRIPIARSMRTFR